MATKTIQLQSIPKNWYMSWHMNTQAAFNVCVTLKDSSKTYVNNACMASTSFDPPLASGYAQVAGNNMEIDLNIAQSSAIKTVLQPFSVPLPDGTIVGQGYSLLVEDSSDNDYNDLYVTIMAWKANG